MSLTSNDIRVINERDRTLTNIESKCKEVKEDSVEKQFNAISTAMSFTCDTDLDLVYKDEWENTTDALIEALKPQIIEKIKKGELKWK